jgi:hypothetical protein
MKNIHFLPKLMIFSLIISACNSNVKNDQTAIEKTPKTDTSKTIINLQPAEPVKSKEEIEIEKLKEKYKFVQAKYVNFFWGDYPHHIFIDKKGKEYDISIIKDDKYELTTLDDTQTGGEKINSKYRNKEFILFYQNELLRNDIEEIEEYMVVKKIFLVD